MKSFGYYSFFDPDGYAQNGCSRESDERALVVNCAGCISHTFPFTTHNQEGRLDYYLMYISSGTLGFFDGEQRINAGKGELVVFLPNSEYKYTYSGGDELSYFWVHFTGSEAKERLDEFDIQSFPKIYKTLSSDRVSRRFQALFDAYEKRDIYRDRELSAIMERLLVAVAREIDRDSAEMTTLSKSIGYIVSNYSSDIMIPELAKMEHLSTSRYNYLFKLLTGMSPKKYILQLRMSSAAELIRSTDLPLKQIGLMCGYADAYFFSKTFKAFFGVSPREYKKGKRE